MPLLIHPLPNTAAHPVAAEDAAAPQKHIPPAAASIDQMIAEIETQRFTTGAAALVLLNALREHIPEHHRPRAEDLVPDWYEATESLSDVRVFRLASSQVVL